MSRLSVSSVLISAVVATAACAAKVDQSLPDAAPATLPLAISNVFAPSGYMGDGTSGTAVVNDTTCAPRPTGARGECYHFTYTAGPMLWSGVYWQSPANNWGAAEGHAIPPGAVRVAFYAAGKTGGELLKIKVGGIRDAMLPYSDSLSAEAAVTLTPTMTRYTVELGGKTYDKVIGGFSWATNYPEGSDPAATTPIEFYLDDLVWE